MQVKDATNLSAFEDGKRTADKQECHSLETAKLVEYDLKKALSGLAVCLFGKGLCNMDRNEHCFWFSLWKCVTSLTCIH